MYLKKLSLINFKNIREENLEFRPGINCFVGDNGAGKTNVIDAVYFLSMCKSSLAMTDGQNMRHGSDFFLLDGQYLTDEGRSESVVCAFARKGGKTLKRNGKEYERLSDHVGLIPVVIVSPADTMLISDAADERRRYLNGFISQLDRAYLQALVRYNAVLGERNRLLKISRDEQMLCIYDRQLVEQGGIIHRKRSEIAALLEPEVARYYRHLSSDREQVTLEYRSELNDTAQYGDYTSTVITEETKKRMQYQLKRIQDGSFAKEFMDDQAAGAPKFKELQEEYSHPHLETVGPKLRAMFSWNNQTDADADMAESFNGKIARTQVQ